MEQRVAEFEDRFFQKIDEYLPAVQDWFDHFQEHIFHAVGSFQIEGAPEGLFYRFSISENHSAVKGLQVFPFVSVSRLNLGPAKGGIKNLIDNILGGGWYQYGKFFLIAKKNLVNTNNAGLFIVMLTEEFFHRLPNGRFVWMTDQELMALAKKVVPARVQDRIENMIEKVLDDGIIHSKLNQQERIDE